MAPRYLILGASGFVGARLRAVLGPDRAVATYGSRPFAGGVHFDAARTRLNDAVPLKGRGFTHAFILYAMTNIDGCAGDARAAYEVNVESVKRLVSELAEHDVTPVFASSDGIFDGSRGMWTEEDEPCPILTYGRHKAEIEGYLKAQTFPWIVARLSKALSTVPRTHDVLNQWLDALERGQTIRCATDQIFSPADVEEVAGALAALAERGARGIYNVCGPEPISRIALLELLAGRMARYRETGTECIVPCSLRDLDFAEPRPLDVSMSPAKLYALLGHPFSGYAELCDRLTARRYRNTELTN